MNDNQQIEVAASSDHNNYLSPDTRTLCKLVMMWMCSWKDFVYLGMACRELYHMILSERPETNDLWKKIYQENFHYIVPEVIYPYKGVYLDVYWCNYFRSFNYPLATLLQASSQILDQLTERKLPSNEI